MKKLRFELAYPVKLDNGAWRVDVVQNSERPYRYGTIAALSAEVLLFDRRANGEAFDGEFVRRVLP